jgi:hypothetical protein
MRTRVVGLSLVAAALLLAAVIHADTPPQRSETAMPAPGAEAALLKARVEGKYRMLLHQIEVPKDKEKYPQMTDLGFQTRREYAGVKNLSPGWWVYSAPYWYVWRDVTTLERPKRGYGPEQATGEPDTNAAGDIPTAWASQTPDGQKEWVMLEYDEFVKPAAVLVHETYNPGALNRITAFKADGSEVEIWAGEDPTATDAGSGVSEVPVKLEFKTNRIRIFLDSPKVNGWNEIDAVGLRDKDRKVKWAVAAEASTTFAQPYPATAMAADMREDRILRLEREVRELKAAMEEVKKLIKKDR